MRIKKNISLLLVSFLILGLLSGCGKKTESHKKEHDKKTKGALSAQYFEFQVPDGWTFNEEENLEINETYSYVNLYILDGEKKTAGVSIRADVQGRGDFAEALYNIGLDPKEVVLNHAGSDKERKFDDITFYTDNDMTFCGYCEDSDLCISIDGYGDDFKSKGEEVLSTLKISREKSNVEPIPWPWDGTPFTTEAHSVTVGDHTVTAELLPMDQPIAVYDSMSSVMTFVGSDYYVTRDGFVEHHLYENGGLTFKEKFKEPFPLGTLDSVDNIIYVSGNYDDLSTLDPGTGSTTSFLKTNCSYCSVSSSGTFAVDYFTGSNPSLIDMSAKSFTSLDTSEFKSVSEGFTSKNCVCLAGSDDDGNHMARIYKSNGEILATIKHDDIPTGYFGWVKGFAETSNGFILFDGNMRNVIFLDTSGNIIDTVKDDLLFGTEYPWFSDSYTMEDGSIMLLLSEKRPDKSCSELLTYRLSGF